MGLGKLGKTRGSIDQGTDWAHQVARDRVFGRVKDRNKTSLQSKPGPLAGFLDPLLTLHSMMMIKWTQSYPSRPYSYKLRDLLGGHKQAGSKMHLEAIMVQTWWQWFSEFEDALGGHDHATLEAMIERDWSCILSVWSCELGVHNRASVEKPVEAQIDWDFRSTCR